MGTTKKFLPRDDSWSRPKIWNDQDQVDEGASAGRDKDVRYTQPQHTGLKGIVAQNEGTDFAGGNAGEKGIPGTGGTREERHRIAKDLNFNTHPQLDDRTLDYNSPASNTKSKISSAMKEVFNNVPANVKKTGKTGEAKRKMLVAIGMSKVGQSRKK